MAKRNRDTFQKRNPNSGIEYLPLTEDNIEMIEKMVSEDPKYGLHGNEIEKFLTRFPCNKDRDIVIHKILLIDFTNSTNLRFCSSRVEDFSIFKLADQIIQWDIDKKIERGEHDVVDEIAQFGGANIFSFATKYCCYHNYYAYNRDDYSIFDKIVVNTIPQYLDVTQKTICKYKEQGYEKYHNLITDLINTYGLNHIACIRRKLDHFFWYPNRKNKENEEEMSLFENE